MFSSDTFPQRVSSKFKIPNNLPKLMMLNLSYKIPNALEVLALDMMTPLAAQMVILAALMDTNVTPTAVS